MSKFLLQQTLKNKLLYLNLFLSVLLVAVMRQMMMCEKCVANKGVWAGGGGCSPPKFGLYLEFLGSKRNLGKESF